MSGTRHSIGRRDALRRMAGMSLAVAGATLLNDFTATPTHAQTPTPTSAPAHGGTPGVYRFRIGEFACAMISDGTFPQDINGTAVNASPEERTRLFRDAFLPTEALTLQITALYVDTGRNRVLVDTGLGQNAPTSGRLAPNLRAAGIDPDAIDTVILTHAHADHIGGLVSGGRPVFPNARYVMGESEWRFWTENPNLDGVRIPPEFKMRLLNAARLILPAIAPRTERVASDGEIVPGIRTFAAQGHTPGHLGVSVSSGSDTLLYLADATTHHVAALQRPEWVLGLDYDPQQTVTTRLRLLDQAATDRLLVAAYHFPWPNLGHVVRSGEVYRWKPIIWQWEA